MDNQDLLAKQWHRIYQLSYKSQGNKFIDAECIRNRLFLINNKSDCDGLEDLFSELCNDYGKLVDSEKGLNGYQNTLLSEVNTSQSRSRFWKSDLTLERCKKIPAVSNFLNRLEELSSLEDVSKDRKIKWVDSDLPTKPKENAVSETTTTTIAMTPFPRPQNALFSNTPSSSVQRSSTFRTDPYQRVEPMPKRPKVEEEEGGWQRATGGHGNRGQGFYRGVGRGGRDEDDDDDGENSQGKNKERAYNQFKTAKQQLISDQKNAKMGTSSNEDNHYAYGATKKSLGTRRGVGSKFVPPVMNREEQESNNQNNSKGVGDSKVSAATSELAKDPRLQNIDPNMIERISNEIMDHGPPVSWEDIAGLEFAKKTIKEIVLWPMLRPDIFTGLRGPPKGLLLFGPPGTGKTLIGKCIASQSQSTFFSISASSLTSKWVGEGEKMVRALFGVAKVHQPAVIFIDEIDSLLTQRSDTEHESSRRIKTEFLVQLDGTNTGDEDRILVVGATNRPQEIDEAARRRFSKRLYIPLPELEARKEIIRRLMHRQKHRLSEADVNLICSKTEGYSGADMANLCKEAALGPIRRLDFSDIESIRADQVQDIEVDDFSTALRQVKASVSDKDLDLYLEWNQRFGSWGT